MPDLFALRLPRLLLKNTLYNASAYSELFADFEYAVTIGSQFQYSGLHRRLNSASPELCAIRPCARKTRIDSFPNNPPLELGEYAEHLKHRLARGRRSIEPLLMKEETDTLFMKALEYAKQVAERSTKPIH